MEKQVMPIGGVLEAYASDCGNFGKCVAQLSGVQPSIDVFGCESVAEVRILSGEDSVFSRNGCWVGENFNYKGGEIVIAPHIIVVGRYNPIFASPVDATRKHRNGEEVYLDDRVWGELRAMAVKDPEKAIKDGVPFLLSRKGLSAEIPASAFGDDAETVYLFKSFAKDYGLFLQDSKMKISSVPRYVLDEKYVKEARHNGKAIARALWVGSLYYRSDLVGLGRVFGGRRSKNFPVETKVAEKLPIVKTLPNGVVEIDGVKYSRLPEQYQKV